MMKLPTCWLIVGLFMALSALSRADVAPPLATAAVPTTGTLQAQTIFRIGYLRREETGHPGETLLDGLRTTLMADPALLKELRAGGYSDIGLYSCDGAADMVRRLNAREFDLAFTPANLYKEQQAGYTAILKARRPYDIIAPPPSNYVRRLGVVFVSRRSPLFGEANLTADRVREALLAERLAVVSTQSVSGFNAPLLTLATRYQLRNVESGFLWFESSEEVVKAVLSGVATVGACEAGAVESVLRQAGLVPASVPPGQAGAYRDQYVRIIVETDPVVTDPVVVRRGLAPRLSALGRVLRSRIASHSLAGRTGDVQYVETSDDEYRSLKELLDEFNTVIGEVPR